MQLVKYGKKEKKYMISRKKVLNTSTKSTKIFLTLLPFEMQSKTQNHNVIGNKAQDARKHYENIKVQAKKEKGGYRKRVAPKPLS